VPKHVGEKVIINTFILLYMCILLVYERHDFEKMHGMEGLKKMWNVCKIMNHMEERPFLRLLACWVPCMKHASEF
jgi:hypothetical protein